MEERLKPELKAQLEELEAIVEGLEQETALKADVVQQLTESLNRSLAAPSAGKGGPLELESQPKQAGKHQPFPPKPSGVFCSLIPSWIAPSANSSR